MHGNTLMETSEWFRITALCFLKQPKLLKPYGKLLQRLVVPRIFPNFAAAVMPLLLNYITELGAFMGGGLAHVGSL